MNSAAMFGSVLGIIFGGLVGGLIVTALIEKFGGVTLTRNQVKAVYGAMILVWFGINELRGAGFINWSPTAAAGTYSSSPTPIPVSTKVNSIDDEFRELEANYRKNIPQRLDAVTTWSGFDYRLLDDGTRRLIYRFALDMNPSAKVIGNMRSKLQADPETCKAPLKFYEVQVIYLYAYKGKEVGNIYIQC